MPTKTKRAQRVRSPKMPVAITRIPAPAAKPWQLNREEVALVKNHIAKGASDSELQFCLSVARRHKLDPFRSQIWFVKRRDASAEGGHRWIPIVGINGMLHIAARDHRDFGSNDEPEFGPMKLVKWTYFEKHGEIQAPEWARVRIWKKGHEHPVVATVYWDEIYPDVGAAPLVRQMPRLMLGKCALAQAIRRAYPSTDGLYVPEEFQGPRQFTDGGREIVQVTPQDDPRQSARAVLRDKLLPMGLWCRKHDCPTSKCPSDEHTQAEHRLMEAAEQKAKQSSEVPSKSAEQEKGDSPPAAVMTQPEPRKFIEVDISAGSPVLRGNGLSNLSPLLQEHCTMEWKGDWWHCQPKDLETVKRICTEVGYEFRIIGSSVQPPGQKDGAKRPAKSEASPGPAPEIVSGVIERVVIATDARSAGVTVLADGKHQSWKCWDKDVYAILAKNLGKEVEIILRQNKQWTNIVGLRKCAGIEYEDGKIPIVQQSKREAGSKTLF